MQCLVYLKLRCFDLPQIEKEVTEVMNKALKYCHPELDSTRKYRAAIIHHRLGSLYHHAYRKPVSYNALKNTRTVVEPPPHFVSFRAELMYLF